VYVTAQNDQQFTAAVAADDSASIPYTLVPVGLSYGALSSITTEIASDAPSLNADGVALMSWGPDPPTGRVDVGVAPPSPSQVSELTSALVAAGISTSPSLTSSTYPTGVSALLQRLLGSDAVTVTVDDGPMPLVAGRYGDTSPFWGGDRVYQPNNPVGAFTCTTAFGMIGNASGHTFTTTAGHCLTGQFYTTPSNSIYMGSTSTSYFLNSGKDDFQTIGTATQGYVWGNGGSWYPVIGQVVPAVGSDITFDGSVTGEVRGVHVDKVGICTDFGLPYPPYAETVCNLIQATGSSQVCNSGDSGGPVDQHTSGASNSPVDAVGTIIGENGNTCWAEEIGREEAVSNTHLQTG
jgi:hypothetical protein